MRELGSVVLVTGGHVQVIVLYKVINVLLHLPVIRVCNSSAYLTAYFSDAPVAVKSTSQWEPMSLNFTVCDPLQLSSICEHTYLLCNDSHTLLCNMEYIVHLGRVVIQNEMDWGKNNQTYDNPDYWGSPVLLLVLMTPSMCRTTLFGLDLQAGNLK